MTEDDVSIHSWIATKILPTLMKMDETSTTRFTCLYKFTSDPQPIGLSPSSSSDHSEQTSLETSVSLSSSDKARGATVMLFVKYTKAIAG